jgi:hypothetical protein
VMAILLGILAYAFFAGIQWVTTPWTRARRT